MPLKPCQTKGKSGYKYGDTGHCYPGNTGRAKAIEQMKAIKASRARVKKGK